MTDQNTKPVLVKAALCKKNEVKYSKKKHLNEKKITLKEYINIRQMNRFKIPARKSS